MKSNIKILLGLSFLLLTGAVTHAQTPTYQLILRNDSLVSSTVYEFDIAALRTGSTTLELAQWQLILTFDPTVSSGTKTFSLKGGSSQLNASQVPSTFSVAGNELRINPTSPPGAGNGTIIPVSPGLTVGRFRLTSSLPFVNKPAMVGWKNSSNPFTKVFAYVAATNTDITDSTGNLNTLTNTSLSPLSITSVSPRPPATAGVLYRDTLKASGGTPPYSWALTGGALPGGFSLSSSGVVSGTATLSGTYNFTVQVTDLLGASISKDFALTVNPGAASALAFVQQPTNGIAGANISPPVTIRLQDQFANNVLASGISISMSKGSGTGSLMGVTTEPTDTAGVATFDSITFNQPGIKTIKGSGAGLAAATSDPFTLSSLTIVASAGSNGSIAPSGSVNVIFGATQAFTITPNTGYHVDSVFVDSVNQGAITSYTFTNVQTDHTIRAVFAINKYTITSSAGTHGTIAPLGATIVNFGGSQSYTITPDTGYHVDSLIVDGTNQGQPTTFTFTAVNANHTIRAVFAINQFTITATTGPNGTIAPPGATVVNFGANQSYTITPNTGYHVDSLIVDGANVGSVGAYTFTNVTANHTIRSVFAINQFTITATTGPNGTIAPPGATNVNFGGSQAYTLTPNTGYHVDSLIVDGTNQGQSTTFTFTAVSANHTIRAVFAINQYTITATTGPNGTIAPLGATNVSFGGSQAYTVTPNTGYHIDSVIVDGVTQGAIPTFTFTNVQANHTIRSVFAINQFTITATTGSNGTISPLGATIVNYGSNKAYTITPNSGYHVDSLIVDGVDVDSVGSYTFVNVSANHTIRSVFALNQFTITATTGPNGTIAPLGATNVSFGGSQAYTVTPNTGYHIDSVIVDGVTQGAIPTFTFTNVQANHTIRSVFAINQFTITATTGPNGTIAPLGATIVNYGSNKAYTITPNSGYHVDSLIVDGVDVDSVGSYTFVNVTANHAIRSVFAINQFTITATTGPNGTIAPSGSVNANFGASQAFSITPNTGYHIDSVIVDGVTQGAIPTYTFTNIQANHTIRSVFAINQFTITATTGSNGTISPLGATIVNYGSNKAYTITPNSGYHVDSLIVDGVDVDSVGSYTFVNVTANHTIRPVFAINQFTITATTGPNGTIAPLGATAVNFGGSQAYTLTPNTGYHVDSLIVDGTNQGQSTTFTFTSVSANHTIRAVFRINQFAITSSAGPNGTIAPLGATNVNFGANQGYTITPNTGYHIDSVIVDGTDLGQVASYTFTNVTSTHTIRAVFAINQFTITSSAGTNGTIAPLGATIVNYGSNQSYTITPNTGYHVDSLLVDGANVGSVGAYTFTNVTANHTIRSVFALNQFTITATTGPNGSITPSGSVNANFGGTQSFTITPNTGYHIDSVIVDGAGQGAIPTYTFTNIQANHAIRAVFAINQFVITSSAGANGTIAPLGSTIVNYGSNKAYTITPNSGYHVDSLIVDGAKADSTTSYTFVNITGAHTIRAVFAINQFTIAATAGANGTINPSGSVNANFGGSQAFTISPSTGYHIDSVIVDGASQGAVPTYTFTNIQANHTIRAVFAVNTFTITSSAGANGAISPNGATLVNYGSNQSYTITPNTGYHVDSLIADGANQGPLTTYTFTNVTSAHTIRAVFRINQYTITATTGPNGTIAPLGATLLNFGASQSYAVTANSGYHVDSLIVDGTDVGSVGAYTFSSVSANHTIRSVFAINQFTITATTGLNGSIAPLGAVVVDSGANQSFTVTPNTGYHVDSLIVDGANVGPVGAYTFTNVKANHTIRSVFAINKYTITATSGPNGSISPSGSVIVSDGASQKFTFTPVTGYGVDSVIVDGVKVDSVVSYTFVNVTSAHAIRVVFAANILSHTVTTVPVGLNVIIDGGAPSPSPRVVNWLAGTSHTIAVLDTVSGPTGVRYVWSTWSDAGAKSHSVSPVVATTFTANFTTQYFLTMSANPGGSVTPPSGWYSSGQNVVITAIPLTNYSFISWAGTGNGSYSGTINPKTITIGGPVSETASFQRDPVTVTIQTNPPGRGFSIDGSATYTTTQTRTWQPGDVHNVNVNSPQGISPSMQYAWKSWSDGGAMFHVITVPDSDNSYTANFALQYLLTTAAGTGGSVAPSPSFQDSGSVVQLTATAFTGFHFAKWRGSGTGSYTGLANPANVTMLSPVADTAIFAPDTLTITATSDPNGSISPSGSVPVQYGTDRTFTFTANPGYHVADVAVDGSSIGARASYIFTYVTVNHTIAVSYAINQFTITSSAGAGGAISPNGPTPVNYGGSQSYTVTPNTGYHIDSVIVDGANAGPVGTYTFTNVTATHTIRAVFAINQYTITSSAGANGTISPSGSVIVNDGASQKFTFTPVTGYGVDSVIVDGVKVDSVVSYTFVNVTSAHTIRVTFAANILSHTVTTVPVGLNVIIDGGAPSPSPRVVNWLAGTSHTIAVSDTVSGPTGVRYVWSTWSDAGAKSHSVSPLVATTFTANFTTQYFLTMSANLGGTTTPPNGWYNAGQNVLITAIPDASYDFTLWAGSGTGSYTGSLNPRTITIGGPISEIASFQRSQVIATFKTNPPGRGFSIDGSVTYTTTQTRSMQPGDVHNVNVNSPQSISPSVQYAWKSWSDGGAMFHVITVPDTDITYTANFALQYLLTTAAGTGGSVTPAPSFQDSGSVVQLTATAFTGYHLAKWRGSGTGSYTGLANPANVTMLSPVADTAIFAPDTLTITATSDPNGSISPSGSVPVQYGTDRTFTFTANPGYHVADVVVDGSSIGARASYIFTYVTVNHSIAVSYAVNNYTITASSGPNGSISPSGVVGLSTGMNQNFIMTPASGYHTDSVKVDGVLVDSTASYTFTNVHANHTISVTFAPNAVAITVATNPSGRVITVDGIQYSSPKTFNWTAASIHTIAAPDSQMGDAVTRFLFVNWSDGGAKTHAVSTLRDTTFTARFRTQYLLTTSADSGGSATPTTAFQDSGLVVQIHGIAAPGYRFTDWNGTGPGEYTGPNNPVSITMNGPIFETASFARYNAQVTVQSNPAGLKIIADGIQYNAPQTFSWLTGSTHTLGVVDTQNAGPVTRYLWSSWSNGRPKTQAVTVVGDSLLTANFKTQYFLTMSANPGGSVTPPSGWYLIGQNVVITAIPLPNYSFISWAGTGNGSYSGTINPNTITIGGVIAQTASFQRDPVTVTIQTNPPGRGFSIDGSATYTTTQTRSWQPGDVHNLNVNSPQGISPSMQYAWKSWSDGGAMFHTLTVPDTDTSYTANFALQYLLTTVAGTGGTVTPAASFHDSGSAVTITGTPNPGQAFLGWKGGGAGSYTGPNNPAIVYMNGPLNDTARFVPAIRATITTTPAARMVLVDGSTYSAPKSFDWLAGSQHTIAAVTPQLAGTDTQYVFAGWSDSGAISHMVAPTSDTVFGAVFKARYYLTMLSNAGGTVFPSSGWFDENQTVTIRAVPNSGYHFNAWTGTGNGSYSGFIDTTTVTMRAAIAEVADFGVILSPPILAGLPDSANGVTTSPVFHWMHYAGASTYRLQLSKRSDFSLTSYDSSGIVDTSIGLTLLANLQMYHWRVSAAVGTNHSPFSTPRSFTTLNATIAASSPLVNWGTGYRYAIHWTSTDLSGPVNIRLSTNNGTSYIRVADSVQNTGLYRWTIPDSLAFISAACILKVESAFNNLLFGVSNAFSIVSGTLPASVPMSETIAYPAEPTKSTDYKLVSVPGIVDSTRIGTLLSGQQGTDWRMFRDNGNAENYLVELSPNSLLTTGEGYWLIKKGNLDIPTFNMKMPRLTQDATYSVPLDSGWNIIANPFDKTLQWGAVLDANGLPSGTELLGYNGDYPPVDSLVDFTGYYFDNTTNLQSLAMPYPFGGSSPASTAGRSPAFVKTWALQLEFDSDINSDRENYIGIAPAAAQGLDQLDMHKPPLFLDQGYLYFKRPDWDARYPRFRSDFRPAIGGGQEWNFEITNPRLSEGTIRVHGIENIPAEYAVVIVNAYNSNPVDARVQPVYSFKTVGKTMPFKILVGPRSFVDAELSKLVPQSFELMQNFPNPFNLSTSISVSLPKETQLRLEVYNILGQRVRSLAEGEYAPGIHTFVWDGADGSGRTAASGVYMYRVTEGGTLLGVKKMILTK